MAVCTPATFRVKNNFSWVSGQWQCHYDLTLNVSIVRGCPAYSMTQWEINKSVESRACIDRSKRLANQFLPIPRTTAGMTVSSQGWGWTADDHYIRWLISLRGCWITREKCFVSYLSLSMWVKFSCNICRRFSSRASCLQNTGFQHRCTCITS